MICKLDDIANIEEAKWHEFSLQLESGLVSIMLLKNNEQYIGFKNHCPHQGRRMDYSLGQFLTTPNGNIVCPAHGAEFNPETGLCVNGPCLGQSLQAVKIQSNEESVFAIIK